MITQFKNAQIVDPRQDDVAQGDLWMADGVICAPAAQADQVIDCAGLYLAPGIVDIGVKVGEPGERHKESFKTAGQAAARGGVTTLVTRPDGMAALDRPEDIEFVIRRAREACAVRMYPIAALTKGRDGTEMAELGFLQDAGAVAFSDGDHVLRDTKVMARALTYAKSIGALTIGHPQEPYLSNGASVTSGKFATLKGLPAVSAMAERMGLDRDIAMIEMTGAAYHFDQITTARALPALERAKANGLDVSAGTSIHHVTLNELDVANYRTFFKVKPPLRSEDDRMATVEALRTGLIDILCSMHTPQDEESKRLPFEEAASGAVGLETFLPAVLTLYHGGYLDLATLFKAISLNPAKRLGLGSGRLSLGAPADLLIFDAEKSNVLDRSKLRSKSKNTPFDGRPLEGIVLETYVNGQQVFEHEKSPIIHSETR